jgi:hypothetical protein
MLCLVWTQTYVFAQRETSAGLPIHIDDAALANAAELCHGADSSSGEKLITAFPRLALAKLANRWKNSVRK